MNSVFCDYRQRDDLACCTSQTMGDATSTVSSDPTNPANHGVHPTETNGGATYATYP